MNSNIRPRRLLQLLTIILLFWVPFAAYGLAPEEILIIANRNAGGSVDLARYYMRKRSIPDKNLIALRVTNRETLSRSEFLQKILLPVKEYLQRGFGNSDPIRCLVLMYGMPLRISSVPGPPLNKIKELVKIREDLVRRSEDLASKKSEKANGLKQKLVQVKKEIRYLQTQTTSASVDSEIALIRAEDYALEGWLINPYFIGLRDRKLAVEKNEVLMVSRLDGPSTSSVKRIIDDSIAVEKKGLQGKAYFDARWKEPVGKKVSGYALYDRSIHRAAKEVRESGLMPVVVDDTDKLFQPGEGPDAALYCGWYSLAKYVDAFTWRPGAVGYHIASSECRTLKRKKSRVWCKMMIEKGVAATIGPVGEPYVEAFPPPEIFFRFLIDGYLTLAECYLVSTPFWSWKMILVGDPLYRPFYKYRR